MSRRREQKEAHKQVNTRVANLNSVLELICTGRVEAQPIDVLRWRIVPSWKRETLPIRCDGLSLVFHEEIMAVPTEIGFRLTCVRFEYKVEATKDLIGRQECIVPSGWHFRYELDDKGLEHSFAASCVADAIRQAKARRRPPYHMHVAESQGLSDNFHYPLGEPSQPLDLVFEILRLVKDEFLLS